MPSTLKVLSELGLHATSVGMDSSLVMAAEEECEGWIGYTTD